MSQPKTLSEEDPFPPFRSSNAHGTEQAETTLLDRVQLARSVSSGRGSPVPVQMLVREGSLAGNTRAASHPDFFIDPTHIRLGRWPASGTAACRSLAMVSSQYKTATLNKPMETHFVGKGKCLS